jgi:putative transposase
MDDTVLKHQALAVLRKNSARSRKMQKHCSFGLAREAGAETGVSCSSACVIPVKSRCDAVPTRDFDRARCRVRPVLIAQVIVPISYGFASRESFSAEATGVLSRACGEARRLTDAARLTLVLWSRWFSWKDALVIVKPETLIGWHRKCFKLFWRWKSRPGRPRLPREIRQLIVRMARENPTWGQARVADELSLKLGIFVAPRTVRKYWPWPPDDNNQKRVSTQRWATFVRNHADAIVACDFMTVVTARFQFLYVLVMLELGSRRILHCNVTAHPTAEWTFQQFREGLPGGSPHRFVIHDRDAIFSWALDEELVRGLGVRVLRTPPQSPQANAFCERLTGTMRRECLDFLIPLNERHLRRMLREWVLHYNSGRPHSSLGPGIPDRGRNPTRLRHYKKFAPATSSEVVARPVLGGLHNEYAWKRAA